MQRLLQECLQLLTEMFYRDFREYMLCSCVIYANVVGMLNFISALCSFSRHFIVSSVLFSFPCLNKSISQTRELPQLEHNNVTCRAGSVFSNTIPTQKRFSSSYSVHLYHQFSTCRSRDEETTAVSNTQQVSDYCQALLSAGHLIHNVKRLID